jgi:hypothetical protein
MTTDQLKDLESQSVGFLRGGYLDYDSRLGKTSDLEINKHNPNFNDSITLRRVMKDIQTLKN